MKLCNHSVEKSREGLAIESAHHVVKGRFVVTGQTKRIKADIARQRAVEKLGAGSEGEGLGHIVTVSHSEHGGGRGAVGSDKGRGGGGGCGENSELHGALHGHI